LAAVAANEKEIIGQNIQNAFQAYTGYQGCIFAKGETDMANGHGGRRPGAGRPRKPLAEKLLDGNPGKQKLKVVQFDGVAPTIDPPDYLSYYGSKKAGTPDSEDIYRETVQWLEQTGCLHLVNAALVLDYAIAKAHWYECERFITSQGLYYSPEGKKLVENPVVETSVKYFKMADIAWSKIWDIVAQNCEHSFGGENPHSDAMAKLLNFDPRE
jgi:hypothetical protein